MEHIAELNTIAPNKLFFFWENKIYSDACCTMSSCCKRYFSGKISDNPRRTKIPTIISFQKCNILQNSFCYSPKNSLSLMNKKNTHMTTLHNNVDPIANSQPMVYLKHANETKPPILQFETWQSNKTPNKIWLLGNHHSHGMEEWSISSGFKVDSK